jgi:hypothetical protein
VSRIQVSLCRLKDIKKEEKMLLVPKIRPSGTTRTDQNVGQKGWDNTDLILFIPQGILTYLLTYLLHGAGYYLKSW